MGGKQQQITRKSFDNESGFTMTGFRYILMKGSVITGAANLFWGKYFMFSSSISLSLHSDETNWARSIGIV